MNERKLARRALRSRETSRSRYLRYGFFALLGLAVGAALARLSSRDDGPEVEQRIRTRIGEDPRTAEMPRVNVEVNDGIAELRGTAPSEEAKLAAGEIAQETEGVREVRNLISETQDVTQTHIDDASRANEMTVRIEHERLEIQGRMAPDVQDLKRHTTPRVIGKQISARSRERIMGALTHVPRALIDTAKRTFGSRLPGEIYYPPGSFRRGAQRRANPSYRAPKATALPQHLVRERVERASS